MKNGNLSDRPSPAIAFRFEGILKTQTGQLNRAGKAKVEDIFNKRDCNIYIVTTEDDRKAKLFCIKWGIPYAHIVVADSKLEIPLICLENKLLRYYDSDKDIVSNVKARAQHVTDAFIFDTVEVA